MKKLCVIFGGASCEHDISVITGLQLAKKLKDKKVEKIYLGLDNKFYLATKIDELNYFSDKSKINLKQIFIVGNAIYFKDIFFRKYCDIECVINCCHGGIGEDGNLSGFFATNKIKFTNSNCLSSSVAMNKDFSKKILKGIVPTIKGELVTKWNLSRKVELIKKNFSNVLIVKPNSLGSSIGVKICNKENFFKQIETIFHMQDSALVEERIVDRIEYNQACYKKGEELVLSAIERPINKDEFLTFDDKYKTGNKKFKDRELPAEISKNLMEKITNYTKLIYETLNLNGVVRVDYIFDKAKNKLYFNEVNTIPGSMAIHMFEAVSIDALTMIDDLIENADSTKEYVYFNTDILKDY